MSAFSPPKITFAHICQHFPHPSGLRRISSVEFQRVRLVAAASCSAFNFLHTENSVFTDIGLCDMTKYIVRTIENHYNFIWISIVSATIGVYASKLHQDAPYGIPVHAATYEKTGRKTVAKTFQTRDLNKIIRQSKVVLPACLPSWHTAWEEKSISQTQRHRL